MPNVSLNWTAPTGCTPGEVKLPTIVCDANGNPVADTMTVEELCALCAADRPAAAGGKKCCGEELLMKAIRVLMSMVAARHITAEQAWTAAAALIR